MTLLRTYVRQVLTEALVPPVRNWLQYARARKKEWLGIHNEYEAAQAEYDRIKSNEETMDDFDDYLRDKYQREFDADDVRMFLYWMLKDYESPRRIVSAIEAVIDAIEGDWEWHSKKKFMSYFYDSVKNEELRKRIDRFLNYASHEDPEFNPRYYEDPQRWEAYISSLTDLAQRTKAALDKTAKKLDANYKYWAMKEYEDRPETEDVETLYHASANARELLEKGFTEDFGQRGTGLGRPEEGVISFTYDQKIAYDIAHALKVGVMIANGELKGHTVWRWLEDEGIDPRKAAEVHGREVLKPDEPHKVWNLYNYWLWNNKIGRGNPVFMTNAKSLMEYLATKTKDDVGVLKAKVNMRHPGISFVKGEREFRVPPAAILSIDEMV